MDLYPHLAPELRALGGDAVRLWGDVPERARAVEAILAARDRTDLQQAVARVDRAVVAGLRALHLPRGLVRAIQVEPIGRGWLGRKTLDCSMRFDSDVLRLIPSSDRPDVLFQTWAHESLHARLPYSIEAHAEQREFRGFEEGLAESLARLVMRKAGISPPQSSYTFYVAAYRVLASQLGGGAEQLLRELWKYPTGNVRAAFPAGVGRLWRDMAGHSLTTEQTMRLRRVADRLLSTSRQRDEPDEGVMARLWESVFR